MKRGAPLSEEEMLSNGKGLFKSKKGTVLKSSRHLVPMVKIRAHPMKANIGIEDLSGSQSALQAFSCREDTVPTSGIGGISFLAWCNWCSL
jgi:hypothetical protein